MTTRKAEVRDAKLGAPDFQSRVKTDYSTTCMLSLKDVHISLIN